MNVESISTAAGNLYGNYASKNVDSELKFSIPRADEQTESTAIQNSDVDVVSTMESMTNKAFVSEPSYTITDEEREYFREKYGEEYDEEKACELYYQLADSGIITENSAGGASGHMAIRRVEFNGPVPFLGYGKCDLVSLFNAGAIKARSGERRLVKSIEFTDDDKNSYKLEWDTFKSQYDREIITWEDALQEQIDFRVWWKDYALNDTTGKPQPSQMDFNIMIADLEKTKDIIMQIFG